MVTVGLLRLLSLFLRKSAVFFRLSDTPAAPTQIRTRSQFPRVADDGFSTLFTRFMSLVPGGTAGNAMVDTPESKSPPQNKSQFPGAGAETVKGQRRFQRYMFSHMHGNSNVGPEIIPIPESQGLGIESAYDAGVMSVG